MGELSAGAQAIIQRFAGAAGALAGAHAGLCSVTGLLAWPHPTLQEYEALAKVRAPCPRHAPQHCVQVPGALESVPDGDCSLGRTPACRV